MNIVNHKIKQQILNSYAGLEYHIIITVLSPGEGGHWGIGGDGLVYAHLTIAQRAWHNNLNFATFSDLNRHHLIADQKRPESFANDCMLDDVLPSGSN